MLENFISGFHLDTEATYLLQPTPPRPAQPNQPHPIPSPHPIPPTLPKAYPYSLPQQNNPFMVV